MAFKQEVNVPLVLTIGIISGLLVLVIVIGMQAWYQSEEQNEMAVKAAEAAQRPDNWLVQLQRGQQLVIDEKPHWTDEQKQSVAIPIGQAMEYLADHDGRMPSTQPSGQAAVGSQ
jgi:hypothetical protein